MQSNRRLGVVLAAAAIVLAVVLFIVLQGNDESDSGSTTAGPTKIAFQDGQPVGGIHKIDVNKGDHVRLQVTPDFPAEVHIHGYEVSKDVKPNQTAAFDFPATAEGVFEVEAHHLVHGEEGKGVPVADLEVTP